MSHDADLPTRDGEVLAIPTRRWIRWILIACIAFQVFLVFCDYRYNYHDVFEDRSIRRIWNIARENSIPTWFSSMQAHALGLTAISIAAVQRGRIARWRFWGWLFTGAFFVWIGVDDFAEIHEKLGGALERMAQSDGGERGGLVGLLLKNPSFSWHTFIAPAYAVGGLLIAVFVFKPFWQHGLFRYVVVGFAMWAASQGLDYAEGLDDIDDFYDRIQQRVGVERDYFVPHTFKVTEEVLEMLGTALLWFGFLRYFAAVTNGLQVRFGGADWEGAEDLR